jgi:hypothetical protein
LTGPAAQSKLFAVTLENFRLKRPSALSGIKMSGEEKKHLEDFSSLLYFPMFPLQYKRSEVMKTDILINGNKVTQDKQDDYEGGA